MLKTVSNVSVAAPVSFFVLFIYLFFFFGGGGQMGEGNILGSKSDKMHVNLLFLPFLC